MTKTFNVIFKEVQKEVHKEFYVMIPEQKINRLYWDLYYTSQRTDWLEGELKKHLEKDGNLRP